MLAFVQQPLKSFLTCLCLLGIERRKSCDQAGLLAENDSSNADQGLYSLATPPELLPADLPGSQGRRSSSSSWLLTHSTCLSLSSISKLDSMPESREGGCS